MDIQKKQQDPRMGRAMQKYCKGSSRSTFPQTSTKPSTSMNNHDRMDQNTLRNQYDIQTKTMIGKGMQQICQKNHN